MQATPHTQDQLDRAREWLNEHCSDAEGPTYDVLLTSALADIGTIDASQGRSDHEQR